MARKRHHKGGRGSGEPDLSEAVRTVRKAIQRGVRHADPWQQQRERDATVDVLRSSGVLVDAPKRGPKVKTYREQFPSVDLPPSEFRRVPGVVDVRAATAGAVVRSRDLGSGRSLSAELRKAKIANLGQRAVALGLAGSPDTSRSIARHARVLEKALVLGRYKIGLYGSRKPMERVPVGKPASPLTSLRKLLKRANTTSSTLEWDSLVALALAAPARSPERSGDAAVRAKNTIVVDGKVVGTLFRDGCKERPSDNTASGGAKRGFIPWCK